MRQISSTQHLITANAISADGTTVVGQAGSPQTCTEPFIWSEPTGLQLLGHLLPPSVGGQADDVSDDGSVVVGVTASALASYEAFHWMAARGIVGLGDLPGGDVLSVALAVSDDGRVVVGQYSPEPSFYSHAAVVIARPANDSSSRSNLRASNSSRHARQFRPVRITSPARETVV